MTDRSPRVVRPGLAHAALAFVLAVLLGAAVGAQPSPRDVPAGDEPDAAPGDPLPPPPVDGDEPAATAPRVEPQLSPLPRRPDLVVVEPADARRRLVDAFFSRLAVDQIRDLERWVDTSGWVQRVGQQLRAGPFVGESGGTPGRASRRTTWRFRSFLTRTLAPPTPPTDARDPADGDADTSPSPPNVGPPARATYELRTPEAPFDLGRTLVGAYRGVVARCLGGRGATQLVYWVERLDDPATAPWEVTIEVAVGLDPDRPAARNERWFIREIRDPRRVQFCLVQVERPRAASVDGSAASRYLLLSPSEAISAVRQGRAPLHGVVLTDALIEALGLPAPGTPAPIAVRTLHVAAQSIETAASPGAPVAIGSYFRDLLDRPYRLLAVRSGGIVVADWAGVQQFVRRDLTIEDLVARGFEPASRTAEPNDAPRRPEEPSDDRTPAVTPRTPGTD